MSYKSPLTIYARGFLGSGDKAAHVERTAPRKPFPTIFDTAGKNSLVVVNPEIMRDYEQLVRKDIRADKWDFREQVIRDAISAFGTNGIYEWIYMNLKSQTISQTHIDFLEDMMNFVTGCTERRLPPKTWEDLIMPQVRSGPVELKGSLRDIFQSKDLHWVQMPNYDMTIPQFITRYLSRPCGTGFSDMVVTLNTLFGDFTFH